MLGPKLIRVSLMPLSLFLAVASTYVSRAVAVEPVLPAPTVDDLRESVLVMRDGGVLQGRIVRSAERYRVIHGQGEISVPVASVAMVCASLEDAYLRQRREMQSPTADTHLQLANWCLTNALNSQAEAELAAARKLDARHPKLELLERRLAVVSRPVPERKSVTAVESTSADAMPERSPMPVPPADLPEGVVERFTRRVQPLVVNNCTSGGCHRTGGKQTFQLDRALLHGMANRRSTMSNLAAVLQLVDREQPQESALLTIPRLDHGGMEHPIFSPRHSSQFQQLVDWVALVTQPDANAEGEPNEGAEQLFQQTRPPQSPPVRTVSQEQVPTPPRWRQPVEAASFEDSVPPPFQPSTMQYGARLHAWQPKDPFDPEIFNRQTQATSATR
jgi:hypothetical protein